MYFLAYVRVLHYTPELCNCKEPAMSGRIEQQHVDTNSAEFKQGEGKELILELKKEVEDDEEAGLNAGKDRKNWKAGPVSEGVLKETSTPLFMSDSPEGNQGNAQDEKDESAE
jgi:hypothetical protein